MGNAADNWITSYIRQHHGLVGLSGKEHKMRVIFHQFHENALPDRVNKSRGNINLLVQYEYETLGISTTWSGSNFLTIDDDPLKLVFIVFYYEKSP